MKNISLSKIEQLKTAPQYFRDCYLLSSVGALARSENGRKILQNNICSNGHNGFRVRFLNVKNKEKDFYISKEELDNFVPSYDEFENLPIKSHHNPIINAIECSVSKLVDEHPMLKPLISRMVFGVENFEFNIPSNFMKLFTGRKPLTVNEKTFRMNLKHKQDAVEDLFEHMKSDEKFSFIAGTAKGTWRLPAWHCYSIEKVKDSSIVMFDHRIQKSIEINKEEFLRSFKYITGYFNDMLK